MPRKSKELLTLEASGHVAAEAVASDEIRFPDEIHTDELRSIYERIYRANPSAHLYTEASQPILIQLCRHVVNSNRIDREIHRVRDPKLLIQLSRAQRDESAAIASLSTKIRLNPSAIADHRGNLLPKPDKPKPWEWR